MYNNPEMLDDADISDVIVDEQSYIPIVNHFKYLGRFISRVVTDDRYTDVRILKAGNAFQSIRKSLLRSQYVHDSVKGSVYESLILPILLNLAVFKIEVFEPCVMSIDCKLVYIK